MKKQTIHQNISKNLKNCGFYSREQNKRILKINFYKNILVEVVHSL